MSCNCQKPKPNQGLHQMPMQHGLQQPVNQPMQHGLQQPVNQPMHHGMQQQANQPMHHGMQQQANQPMHHGMQQPVNQPMHHGMQQPVNQPMHHGMQQPMNQSMHHGLQQPMGHPSQMPMTGPQAQMFPMGGHQPGLSHGDTQGYGQMPYSMQQPYGQQGQFQAPQENQHLYMPNEGVHEQFVQPGMHQQAQHPGRMPSYNQGMPEDNNNYMMNGQGPSTPQMGYVPEEHDDDFD